MKTTPLLFTSAMVRAMLEDRKTQTRRLLKPAFGKRWPIVDLSKHGESDSGYSGRFDDPDSWGYAYAEDGADMPLGNWLNLCPYGGPGDLIWVREAYARSFRRTANNPGCTYRADYMPYAPDQRSPMSWRGLDCSLYDEGGRWTNSIHMFRWASRITLRLTDVRVERVNSISETDAQAEGVTPALPVADERWAAGYARLWEDINGAGSWQANPWVWALTFEVIHENVDTVLAKLKAAA